MASSGDCLIVEIRHYLECPSGNGALFKLISSNVPNTGVYRPFLKGQRVL